MLMIDVSFAAYRNWILEIRFSSHVFLQMKYGKCCCFGPNNMAEFGLLGKKTSAILIIAKGIPFLGNRDVVLDIVQLGLTRREIKLHSTKPREDLDEYQV